MKNLVLIFGGPSEEHTVSLVSAKNIYEVLQNTDLTVFPIGVTHNKEWKLIKGEDLLQHSFEAPINLDDLGEEILLANQNDSVQLLSKTNHQLIGSIDVAFPICHGPFGEDGKLQSFLEDIKLPFVGSSSLACAISLDKDKTKVMIKTTDVPQVPYIKAMEKIPFETINESLQLPWFVKPSSLGSSIGISKVKNKEDYEKAMELAFRYDTKVVIEQGVSGQEIECAILEKNGEVLVTGTGEICPNHEFYSYDAKYIDPNGAQLIYPANVTSEVVVNIQDYARKAFKALGCRGYARVDFFVSDHGQIYFNELNTHPGFTSISMFPKLWELEGLSYKDLILQMLEEARY